MNLLLIICLTAIFGLTNSLGIRNDEIESSCNDLDCKAGRECVMVDGEAKCLCVISCPDHFKPICGSDTKSYDNHCQMHQHACLSGEHIKVNHKGFCKKKKKYSNLNKEWKKDRQHALLAKKDLQEQLQNDLVKTLRKDEKKKIPNRGNRPAVCYGPQRNAIRYLLVDNWQETLKDQSWHVEGMTYRESLWGWFFTCDENSDNFLTPEELLKCAKDVAFFARPGQDNALTKELCIDAMVDDGDRNNDWKLDFEEFTRIMNAKYQPKEKKCSLEGRNYLDGEEIHLICNHCVCAVGNWVCATLECEEDKKTKQKTHKWFGKTTATDFDNSIDEHDLETISILADQWIQKSIKDSKLGKELKKQPKKHDNNPFLDFDTESQIIESEKEEEEELGMDDYYDDLYEISKSKKKSILEDALKEIQLLKQKTQRLKIVIDEAKQSKKKAIFSKRKHNTEKENMMRNYEKVNFRSGSKKSKKVSPRKARLNYSLSKYEDDLFEKNSWNDLISSNDNELL